MWDIEFIIFSDSYEYFILWLIFTYEIMTVIRILKCSQAAELYCIYLGMPHTVYTQNLNKKWGVHNT